MKRTTIAFRMGYVVGRRADPERYQDIRRLAVRILNSAVVQKLLERLLRRLQAFLEPLVTALAGREPVAVAPEGQGR